METGLNGGITSKRMATLVNTYGVDFALSTSTRKRLADVGADDSLLAAAAREFKPMSAAEQQTLEAAVAPHARQLMYYKP